MYMWYVLTVSFNLMDASNFHNYWMNSIIRATNLGISDGNSIEVSHFIEQLPVN